MARSITVIKEQIRTQKNTESALSDLKFYEEGGSKTGIANLWAYTTAVVINLFEQLLDIFKTEIEESIAKGGAGTTPWLRERILEFQTGYNVEYDNGVVAYSEEDTDAQIITRCSVTEDGNRVIKAKVAKSDPPEALSTSEKTELEFYLNQIKFAGTQIDIVSKAADQLYIEAVVEYDGQYAGVIQDSVEESLEAYCENLSSDENFNGLIEVNAIVDAIQSTEGVKRVKVVEIGLRADGVVFASRSTIYNLTTGVNTLKQETDSGYVVPEASSGNTFSDKITYTAV